MFKFSSEHTIASKLVTKHVLAGIAASIFFLSQTNQVSILASAGANVYKKRRPMFIKGRPYSYKVIGQNSFG